MTAHHELVREVCGAVDEAVRDRVLVIGSPPPDGTDLDLLVRPAEEEALRTKLPTGGFVRSGKRFARFRAGAGFEVEMLTTRDWGLSDGALEELFAEARPLSDFAQLSEPSPHHRLLILATRSHMRGEHLSDRRRRRVDRALAEDPQSWRKATQRLDEWGDAQALARLWAAHSRDRPAMRDGVRRALRWPRMAARRRRTPLVALSGIDGSGKSFQVEALRKELTDIGLNVAIEWMPIGENPWIARIRNAIKRPLSRLRPFQPVTVLGAESRGSVRTPSSILRERSSMLNYGWATIVAFANGLAHFRRVARNRAHGKITIFDRYVLDSIARLRFFYGGDKALGLPRAIIRFLSPKPSAAFFLDVTAETSAARKDDGWHLDELGRQVRLYHEEQSKLGIAVRLDGELPAEDLASAIAATVWHAIR